MVDFVKLFQMEDLVANNAGDGEIQVLECISGYGEVSFSIFCSPRINGIVS